MPPSTLLQSSGADSVVTVMPVPHQFTPSSLMRLDGDRLLPALEGDVPSRRQDKPRLFARNGPAVVAVRTPVLVARRTLYGPDTRGLVDVARGFARHRRRFDLEMAELLMAARSAGQGLP